MAALLALPLFLQYQTYDAACPAESVEEIIIWWSFRTSQTEMTCHVTACTSGQADLKVVFQSSSSILTQQK